MLLVCLTLVTGCGKDKSKNEDKKDDNKTTVEVNNNEEVTKDQNIEGIEITNTSLVYEDGISYLKATVTNNTGSDYELNEYKINVKDSDGNIIVTMPGYVGSVLKNGESKTINTTIGEDLSKAYSIEYEVVK
mgnify:FL=1